MTIQKRLNEFVREKGNSFYEGLGDLLTLEMNSFSKYGALIGALAPLLIYGYLSATGSGILSPNVEEWMYGNPSRQYIAGSLVALASVPGLSTWIGIPLGIAGYRSGKIVDNLLERNSKNGNKTN